MLMMLRNNPYMPNFWHAFLRIDTNITWLKKQGRERIDQFFENGQDFFVQISFVLPLFFRCSSTVLLLFFYCSSALLLLFFHYSSTTLSMLFHCSSAMLPEKKMIRKKKWSPMPKRKMTTFYWKKNGHFSKEKKTKKTTNIP